MAIETKIQWAHHTFNPWRGCTKVHAGCTNCYAEATSKRNPRVLGIWGDGGKRVVAAESYWREPLKWNRDWNKRLACRACGLAIERREVPAEVGTEARKVLYCPVHGELDKHCEAEMLVDDSITERPRVFCASLADVMEDWQGPMHHTNGDQLFWPHNSMQERKLWIPERECGGDEPPVTMQDVRDRLFRDVIDACQNLDWLVLTKRPENARRMIPRRKDVCHYYCEEPYCDEHGEWHDGVHRCNDLYRDNLWLGYSPCNQDTTDGIGDLLKCRDLAKVLFLSVEPLIGPVDLKFWNPSAPQSEGQWFASLEGVGVIGKNRPVDLVIVGGESGPKARPCSLEWITSIVLQCRASGVPCFVKQLGSFVVTDNVNRYDFPDHVQFDTDYGRGTAAGARVLLRDPKGGDMSEWPEDLQVREIPA